MKAACEICGTPDRVTEAALLRQGRRELPEIPGFRPAIMCAPCRHMDIEMIRGMRQAAAEADIERERAEAGEPSLDPGTLERAGRRRWEHRAAVEAHSN